MIALGNRTISRLPLRAAMGVDPELIDIIDRNLETERATEILPSDWTRLRIVTSSSL
jgi:hypothetical protein